MKIKLLLKELLLKKRLFKKILSETFFIFILFLYLFYNFESFSLTSYLRVIIGILILFLSKYSFKENKKLTLYLTLFFIVSILSWQTIPYLEEIISVFKNYEKNNIYLNLTMLMMIPIIIIALIREDNQNQDKSIMLIKQRKFDLERIKNMLNQVDVVGINACWGEGKTVIINKLKYDEIEKYEFIEMDLLSCDLDEIQNKIIGEIESILDKYKMLSIESRKLKNLIGENSLSRIIYTFFSNKKESYIDALNLFKKELERLDKKILIVYEDIDRISNVDSIKKVFSISEKLTSDKIKIIYQYDEMKLMDLGFTKEYLEKYIPFVVNLSPISFQDSVEFAIEEYGNGNILKKEDFHFLKFNFIKTHDKIVSIIDNKKFLMSYDENINMRKIKSFIKEIVTQLEEKPSLAKSKKEVIIKFYYIKYFNYDLYSNVFLKYGNENRSLLECINFEDEETKIKYTIFEIKKMINSSLDENIEILKNMFQMKINLEKLKLLLFFDYDLEVEECEYKIQEPIKNQDIRYKNEEKDRIIQNLVFNSRAENTDSSEIAKELIEMVLSKPNEEWKTYYHEFLNKMFHQEFYKYGNSTPCIMGHKEFPYIIKCIRNANLSEEEEIKVIKLYFFLEEKSDIDSELIEILRYLNLKSKKVYLFVLEKFNSFNVIGNMNSYRSYKEFLIKYIQAISKFKYANTVDSNCLKNGEETSINIKDFENATYWIIEDISDNVDDIERKLIFEFIEKNKCIIQHDNSLNYWIEKNN